MKILHVSDTGLPDARIERAARTAAKRGHSVYFCGPIITAQTNKNFNQLFNLEWTPKARLKVPFVWSTMKKRFKNILDTLGPDIVHAHNVCAAKLVSETKYPFVFDDHEHISMELESIVESHQYKDKKERTSILLSKKLWTKWEKEIVLNAPTLTVGESIANDYHALGSEVFVVPNLPNEEEIEINPKTNSVPTTLSTVYAGKESETSVLPFRDITGFVDIFYQNEIGSLTIVGMENSHASHPVQYMGFLPRKEMYQEFRKHHIGILPWKSHWFHKYCNPNKVYEYAHAGLMIMVTSDFADVISMLKNHCVTFTDYNELVDKLLYFKEHTSELNRIRDETLRFARQNLLWEKYENNIIRAYNLC